MDLAAFVAKWSASGASERANKDHFLLDLCDVLEVPRASASTGDLALDLYTFERDRRSLRGTAWIETDSPNQCWSPF